MKVGFAIILVSAFNLAFAQGKYDANWVFGLNAGIDFDNITNPINFYTLSNNEAAAASISDSLGNLLFYIAPDTPFNVSSADFKEYAIFDANNKIISNGDSLNVGPYLMNAIFLPVPRHPDKYFLFYLRRIDTIEASVLDYDNLYYVEINKDSSGFKVIKNQLLSDLPIELRMAAIKHANGCDWWLLVHRSNEQDRYDSTSTFYSYLITGDSIIGPYEQNIGSIHSGKLTNFGQMIFSRDGKTLASVLNDQNTVDLFNFNRCTGQLINNTSLDNIDSTGEGQFIGCAFSSNGNELYLDKGDVGANVNENAVFQLSLDSPNIISNEIILYPDSNQSLFSFGDIRLARDNKIYLSVEGGTTYPYSVNEYTEYNQYLWVINSADSAGIACNLQPYGYLLGDSARSYSSLPNMPNYNLGALSIYQAGAGIDTTICNTDSITIGSPPVAGVTYAWQPAQGITDTTLVQQTVKPDSSTWYYVTLTDTTILYSCQSRTDSVYVQVKVCCDSILLSQCTLSKDTFICTNIDTPSKGASLLATAPQGIVLTWQDIDSSHTPLQIVNPSQSTWYYVTFIDTTLSGSCNSKTDSVYVDVKKCVMGIEEINSATQHLNIYPNPAQNSVTIEWQSQTTNAANIVIYDVLGRVVKKASLSGALGKEQIDVSDLANGLYVVRVLSPSGGGEGGGSAKLAIAR